MYMYVSACRYMCVIKAGAGHVLSMCSNVITEESFQPYTLAPGDYLLVLVKLSLYTVVGSCSFVSPGRGFSTSTCMYMLV